MLYKRGRTWWFKFTFAGQSIRESSKSTSKAIARAAELKRHRDLEEGYNGIRKRERPVLFRVAAKAWLEVKAPKLAPKSIKIEQTNLKHLNPILGDLLITDIGAADISKYQNARLFEGASPKTVNLELGTLRAILRRHRLWAYLQPDVKMLRTADDAGRAITASEEALLLQRCASSRSKALLPVVTLALNTAMRYSEILTLRWGQIDLKARSLTVGKTKTQAGTGRTIPLNDRATAVLEFWSSRFPDRKKDHFVFAAEKYGVAGDEAEHLAWGTDPTHHVKSLKEAWERAKSDVGVKCRFHDLRHTACTRMLEGGAPLPVIATLMGWSAATTVRMARRYGHIGQVAQRQAVQMLDRAPEEQHDAGDTTASPKVS